MTYSSEGYDLGLKADNEIAALKLEGQNKDTLIAQLKARIAELETPKPSTSSFPAKSVSLYWMMWSNSGSPRLSTLSQMPNVNVLRLAFAQGSIPALTGPASEGSISAFQSNLASFRSRGGKVLVSVGGESGSVNIADRTSFIKGIKNIHAQVPLDGLDWDLEGPAMSQSDVLAICETLRTDIPNFAFTMVPNGTYISAYQTIAIELEKRGLLTRMGQQFYDSAVTQAQMMSRIDSAVQAGIKPEHYDIGMSIWNTSSTQHWTLQQCIDNYKAAETKYPGLGGAYFWEAGRTNTANWASQVGNLVLT